LRSVSYKLKFLSKNCDLDDPEKVKEVISNKQCSESYKVSLVKAYNYYATINGIRWVKPKYRAERKMPKIPSTESLNKIISGSSKKYATIFKILMETGVMPHELANVKVRDIDLENGILNVQGFKGHASRSFKLKPETLSMLKVYLSKYGFKDKPFPDSVWIQKMWRKYRNLASEKLMDPNLKTIRLYDLRHYFASVTYHKTRDPIYVKQQMGHKKLETILVYTQLINFGEDEWVCCVARILQEACSLVEQGFEYVTEVDGAKIFRKRK